MGQQQLLLLVLGIVIVGLAVVVGINAFSENRVKSNADALVTDALRIASDAQAWALKPAQFGGAPAGKASLNPTDLTFEAIGYPTSTDGGDYSNVNGNFTFAGSCTNADDPSPEEDGGVAVYIVASNVDTNNEVCVLITGTNSKNIGTSVEYGN